MSQPTTDVEKRSCDCFFWDLLAMLPGWLLLLLMDPLISTVLGIPVAAVLIFARRILWMEHPHRGRFVCGFVMPGAVLALGMSLAFGSGGLALGMLLSLGFIAVVEGWNLRFGRTFLRRFPLTVGAVFVSLSIIFTVLMLLNEATAYPTEEMTEVWSQPEQPPRWSDDAKREAVALVREVIYNRVNSKDLESLDNLYLSAVERYPALAEATTVRGLFVTLFAKEGYTSRGFGHMKDPIADVVAAAVEAAETQPYRPRTGLKARWTWFSAMDEAVVHVDVPGRSRELPRRLFFDFGGELFRGVDSSLAKVQNLGRLLNDALSLEFGIDGLEIVRSNGEAAVVLPTEPVTHGWLTPRVRSGPKKIERLILEGWKEEHGKRPDREALHEFSLRKFRTIDFGEIEPSGAVVDFYRGNVLLQDSLSRDFLVSRTGLAIDWLSRMVKQDGKFHYEVFPPFKGETKDYNLPRHSGSVYGLFAAYKLGLKEPAIRSAGDRALPAGLSSLSYLVSNLRSPDPKGAPELSCFMDNMNRAESGSTALGAIAICELPEPTDDMDAVVKARIQEVDVDRLLSSMGDCMLSMIDPDGAVFRRYEHAMTNERVEKEPLYYPGEVALALVRSYKRTGNKKLLEGSLKIADRQLQMYDWALALDFPWPGDHWIIQALTELAEVTENKEYARLAVLMGNGYVREQYPPQEYIYPDYRGSYRRIVDLPRTTRAASRGEALCGALRSAKMLGEDTSKFRRALVEGARHLLEQQFVEANSYFIPESFESFGGIRMGIADNHLRIDNNQHAIIGLIAALEAMDMADAPGQ